jgi:hypothetical protein
MGRRNVTAEQRVDGLGSTGATPRRLANPDRAILARPSKR